MVVDEQSRRILVEAIDALPEDLKRVFALKYGDEYLTNREIAAVLNVSEREVEVLLIRAYRHLQPPLVQCAPSAVPASLRAKASRAIH